MTRRPSPHSSHWGTFRATAEADGSLTVAPFEEDPDPSKILSNIPSAPRHPSRLTTPLIRRGWLEDGPGPDDRRGRDDYVEVPWDRALGLAAAEMARLGAGPNLDPEGPQPGAAVFGGSYGWASAGRFHHAQSQVHRFLNTAFGGYVASVDTYSSAAGAVILDLVRGNTMRMTRETPYWAEIAAETDLLIAFGGLPIRNLAVSPGGNSQHVARPALKRAAERGCAFVSISPMAGDFEDLPNLTRIAPRPGTDVALMLAMAHRLDATGRADRAYLDRYTVGYDRFRDYVTGATDGIPKTPLWASGICGVHAEDIAALADLAAERRTHIAISYALQRSRQGEQPVWMALTLTAMLGQYALPGGGFSYSLGSIGNTGKPPLDVPLPTLPQGFNRVGDFIPVARIADLLLRPGETYTYRCMEKTYPDIRLVYWAGGNPFHHHQDLTRLAAAFARPDTVIVNEAFGTATARHADIVFPATLTLERDDIGAGGNDPFLVPMPKILAPIGGPVDGPRDDYDIFAALSERLGTHAAFTENRTGADWLRALYEPTRAALEDKGITAPGFDDFLAGDILTLPVSTRPTSIAQFHDDPAAHPLATPSGLIEIFSDQIAAAGFAGHPVWDPAEEWLGADRARDYPFQLIANQPSGRLHSQLDFGAASMAGKSGGREVLRIHPSDAADLGVTADDVVRVFNDRGAFLAAVRPCESIAPRVVQIPTGAWLAVRQIDGIGPACVNGNPNMVTTDAGASGLSQGCAGQLTLVAIEKLDGPHPPVVPHEQVLPRTPPAD